MRNSTKSLTRRTSRYPKCSSIASSTQARQRSDIVVSFAAASCLNFRCVLFGSKTTSQRTSSGPSSLDPSPADDGKTAVPRSRYDSTSATGSVLGRRRLKRVSDIAQLLDQASHLKSYDLARTLRTAPATLIGGFQSPIEKEFLELLLSQPARRAPFTIRHHLPRPRPRHMRIPRPWRDPLAAAPPAPLHLPDIIRRPAAATGPPQRLRRRPCRPYPHSPRPGRQDGSPVPAGAAKPVYTLPSPHNTHLITLGAQPISPPDPVALLAN